VRHQYGMNEQQPLAGPELSAGHELANSLTHGLGVFLGIAGLAVLVVFAALHGTARHIVGCAVYGATLVLLFTTSTLYHSFRSRRVKRVFRVLDHSAIFLLIAGTYTPFTLVTLRGAWGWSLFGVVWGLALLGILMKGFLTGRFRIVSTAVYLLMGWMVLIAIRPLAAALSPAGLAWLTSGGVLFSLGAVFYAWKSLPGHHALWHVFVLAACACHYVAVFLAAAV